MPAKILVQQNFHEYLPEQSFDYVLGLLIKNPVLIVISRHRKTKMADFRVMPRTGLPVISINEDLNKYEFLITLLHEFAHFLHWKQFTFSRKPHGKRWKNHFRELLLPVMNQNVFPADILAPLVSFIQNPLATGNTHTSLTRALQYYNIYPDLTLLDKLPYGAFFTIQGDKVFKKGDLQRKRYKCYCVSNKKFYFVNASLMVKAIYEYNI